MDDKEFGELKDRVRDGEENVRIVSRDISSIKESQASTHKRISSISIELKKDMKEGFTKVDNNIILLKSSFDKYITESGKEVKDLSKFKDRVVTGIKIFLAIPIVGAAVGVIFSIFKFLSNLKIGS